MSEPSASERDRRATRIWNGCVTDKSYTPGHIADEIRAAESAAREDERHKINDPYQKGWHDGREPLEQRIAELAEALLDVLCQACFYTGSHVEQDGWYDTGALSAYRDGWELAVDLGLAERDGELVGRRGFYRPKWDALRPEEAEASRIHRDAYERGQEMREEDERASDQLISALIFNTAKEKDDE